MSVWIFFICVGISGITGFVSGWTVDSWKDKAQHAAELKAAQDAAQQEREFRNTVSNNFETKLSKLRITNTTITQEIHREVEKAVYVDPNCAVPESGIRLRNDRIRAANGDTPEFDAGVPKAAGATRKVDTPDRVLPSR